MTGYMSVNDHIMNAPGQKWVVAAKLKLATSSGE